MPYRRRFEKARQGPPGLADVNALSCGPSSAIIAAYGSLAAGRARWEFLRSRYPHFDKHPAIFWLTTDDVPPELREFVDDANDADLDAAIARYELFQQARTLWLMSRDLGTSR